MNFSKVRNQLQLFLFGTILGAFFAIPLLSKTTIYAATGINEQINFQGRLLNTAGATVPDGFYNIQFKIYQDGDGQSVGNTTGAPAGTLKWTENYLNQASQGVKVQNGFMSVQLGSITAFGTSIDWNQSKLWLSMNIGSTNVSCTPFTSCTPDGEMAPMQAMTSAVYALNAKQLGGVDASAYAQLAANQTWTGINTYRPTTDALNAFQLQKSTTGVGYITADSTNTQLVLGTASSLTGKLAFGTLAGGTLTIVPTSSASSFTITLPAETGTVCTTGSVCAGYQAAGSFVNLQVTTPGTAQTGNINITGAGIIGGNVTIAGALAANGGLAVSTTSLASIKSTNTTSTGLVLSDTDASVGAGVGLEFTFNSAITTNSQNIARILPYTQAGGGGDLLFQTAPSATGAYTTKLTVARDGNIGIGDAAPGSKLVVVDAQTANSGVKNGQVINQTFTPTTTNYTTQVNGLNVQSKLSSSTAVSTNNVNANLRGVLGDAPIQANQTIFGTYGVTGQSGISSGSGTISNAYGVHGFVYQNATGTITNAFGNFSEVRQTGAGTISDAVGYYGDLSSTAGTISKYTLIKAADYSSIVGAGNQYGVLTYGKSRFGDNTLPTETLEVAGNIKTTGSVKITNGANVLTVQATPNANYTITFPNETGTVCTTGSVCGGYANTALSNLAVVAINTSLLPATTNSINVGSSALTFANGFYGTSVQSPLFNTADIATAATVSAGISLRSGNSTGTGAANSGTVTIKSGNSTNGVSGAVTIDAGTAGGGNPGALNLGNTNSAAITLGNTGANTTNLIQGGSNASAIQILQGLGGVVTIGTNGSGSTVNVVCGSSTTCGFANNATDHSTTLGSTTGASLTTLQGGTSGVTITGNITASGTYNTNTFTSTALTFAGASPVISASTTNTSLTVRANGTGILTLNTSGAGTVNLATTNTTTLGIGNTGSTNTVLGTTSITGTTTINNTGILATTIGAGTGTAGNVVIQGGAGTSLSATNTSGTTVLGFAAPSTAGIVTYQLPAGGTGGNTYGICTTFVVCSGYLSSGSYANTALSNLAAVAINTSLLPGVTNSIDIGSSALTFANGFYGTSVQSPLFNTFDQTSASTSSTAVTFRSGNASGTTSSSGIATFKSGNATQTSGTVNISSGNSTTSGNSGDISIEVGTVASGTKGSITLGSANATNVTVGNTSGTTTLIQGGSTLSLQTATSGSLNIGTTNAGSIFIGSTGNTNSITLGQSTAGETINIENGATAAATIVNILSGAGTAGVATLNLGNNTRATSISLGNINPAANRAISLGNSTGVANAFVDTINIATNPTTVAGGNTVNIASGTPTGAGTNLVTIGSTANASTTIVQGGSGNGIQLTQATGANIVIGNPNTGSTVSVQCGAGTSSVCGFGNNANDHTTTIGSTSTVSSTVIQSGSAGITLTGNVVTSGTINTNSLSASALTFSGANPVISASTANTGMTLQSNGTGTLTLNSSGAGTVNVGTSNTTTVAVGNNSAATQTSITGGTGSSALGLQVGVGGTLSVGTITQTTLLNIGNTSASTITTINGGTGLTALNAQVGNGGSINLGTTPQTSVQNIGNISASTTTLINGGTSGTAIQLLQGAGGTVTIGGTGAGSNVAIQCGASATACNFGTNATDHTTTIGSTTTASLTTIQAGTSGISLAQDTTVAANKNLTVASGTGRFIQTFTGTTTDAHSITATALTTGTALKITSINNTAANTSWVGSQFNFTNAQTTTAVTGFIFGADFEFSQNPTVAGNNESAVNIAIAANASSPTDNTVSSILNLANNDDATGNLINVTDAIKISATTANNIINGINFNGTIQSNLIYTSTNNYTLTAAGAVTQAGNLTLSGANPVISASATNTNLTLQTNGTGTVSIVTTGAGTINVGTANTTTIGIGSTTAATQTLIQGGTGSNALAAQVGAGGTLNIGTNNAATINVGSTTAATTTALTGGSGANAVSIQSGSGGTISLGTTSQTSTQNIGNTSASTTTLINGGTGASAIQILQGTGGVVTIGSTGANSAVTVQCGAIATAACSFGANATDHTTTIGSTTTASLTAIQGGTSGITLTSGVTVASVLSAGFNIRTSTNSATAFRVQNTSSFSVVTVDTATPALKIFAGAGGANSLNLTYNDGTSTGTIAASAGTTAVGSGTGAISVLAGTGSAITMTANATSLWRTTAGTLTVQSGTSSDLILTSGSSIVQVSGSSVVKLGASAGDPGTCTAGAIVYNTTTNTLRGCQGSTLAWNDLVNLTIPTLQQTYSASTGSTTPEIKLDTTRTALDIQGDNAGSVATLLNVRAGTASGLGNAIFSVAASGTTTLNDNGGVALLTANGTSGLVQIGTSTPQSTNSTLLVLDNFQPTTAAAEPTEVDGAMYYDADQNQFRCGVNGFWSTCSINSIQSSYVFEDEFLSGTTSAATGTNFQGVGALGWNMTATTSCAVAYNQTGPALTHDHPGTLRLAAPAANGNGCAMTQGGTAAATPTLSQILGTGDVFKTNVAISAQTGVMRVGWTNQTTNTTPTSGAYWEYVAATDATHLRYCYANNGTPTCAAGPVIAANTWAELEIRINATNNITFITNIGGTPTSVTTTGTFDPGTTNKLGPTTTCYSTGTVLNVYIDYIQWSGYNTSIDGIRD
jgi:hypothetical protein